MREIMASSTATEPLTDDQQLSTELQTHSTIIDPATTSLLDLPAPCIHLITRKLRNKQLVSLCQSCRTLMREGLTDRDVTVTVQLHEAGAEHRTLGLRLACQYAVSVHLVLSGAASGRHAEIAAPAEGAADTAEAYLTHAVAALGHTLDKVTQVTLQGMTLDDLVPPWLTATCSNLTRLRHADNVALKLPSPDDPPNRQYPDITTLTQLTYPAPNPATVAPATAEGGLDPDGLLHVHGRQLSALKGLSDLTATGQVSKQCMMCLRAASGLTRLVLPQHRACEALHTTLAASKLPIVQLDIPEVIVDDALLACLLQLPALQWLSCSAVGAANDYSQAASPLRHLTVRIVFCNGLDTFPLHALESLTVAYNSRGIGAIRPSHYPAHNEKVLSEVQRMGGLKWAARPTFGSSVPQDSPNKPGLAIVLPDGVPDTQSLAVCMQLLASHVPPAGTGMHFVVMGPITVEGLGSVQELGRRHVRREYTDSSLQLHPEGVDTALLSALAPAASAFDHAELRLPSITEEQLLQLFCACPRSPHVVVEAAGGVNAAEGWQQRVEAAAKAAVVQAARDGVVSTDILSPEQWAACTWLTEMVSSSGLDISLHTPHMKTLRA